MLRTLFSAITNGDFLSAFILLASYAALIFLMLPVHEFAHAFVADKLGDNTARWNGRLTLNPLKHLDLLGTVMLALCGFGYARPVPVNPRNFEKPKRDMALTALAGPVSNLLMAVLSLVLYRVVLFLTNDALVRYYLGIVFVSVFASINIGLAVFNLLPLYPLDGSRIFAAILPDKVTDFLERNQQVVMIITLVLLFTGVLDGPIYYLQQAMWWIVGTPLGF